MAISGRKWRLRPKSSAKNGLRLWPFVKPNVRNWVRPDIRQSRINAALPDIRHQAISSKACRIIRPDIRQEKPDRAQPYSLEWIPMMCQLLIENKIGEWHEFVFKVLERRITSFMHVKKNCKHLREFIWNVFNDKLLSWYKKTTNFHQKQLIFQFFLGCSWITR